MEDALNATSAEVTPWNEASKDALAKITEKGTWNEVSNTSKGIHVLPRHLVLKIKMNTHEQTKRFKAQVVAVGNKHVYQRNYQNIYTLVVDFNIYILFLIIAFVRGWNPVLAQHSR